MDTFTFGSLLRDSISSQHRRAAKTLLRATRDGSSKAGVHDVAAAQETEQLLTSTWAESPEGAAVLDLITAGTPGTVVFAGDWHGDYEVAATAYAYAQEQDADLIIQVGDFGIWPHTDGLKYLEMVKRFAGVTGIPVAFVDGNHEDFDQLYAMPLHETGVRPVRPGVVHLPRGFVWSWGDVRLAAFGGATSVDSDLRVPGHTWWSQEAVTDADLNHLVENLHGEPVDVLVTHDTTHRVDLAKLGFVPDTQLRAAAQNQEYLDQAFQAAQPQLSVHGHFHQEHDQVVSFPGFTTTVCSLGKERDAGSVAVLSL